MNLNIGLLLGGFSKTFEPSVRGSRFWKRLINAGIILRKERKMELKYIFLTVFALVSLIYLITLSFKPALLQFILKGCLMPLVLAVYITTAGTQNIYWPVVFALVFAWIGDVLLVRITNILWFKLGLASFLIGHIFYCIAMYRYIAPFNITVLLMSAALACCFGVILFKIVKPSRQMKIPVIAYEIVILIMAIFALQFFLSQYIAGGSLFGILVFAGSILFVASDTLLALRTFRRIKMYFAVMLTYIPAQLLITLGFCMV